VAQRGHAPSMEGHFAFKGLDELDADVFSFECEVKGAFSFPNEENCVKRA